ncbi:MAG: D-tyrosyl-tRNA(Tyr) deacylase [Nitrospirota bacterium]|nr:MAG: D-tyrosyl-tRNA(Tyr) deacylase [Nitrospirota bacterium]
MKAVIQRVRKASVETDGRIIGQIERGLLVLLGVAQGDDETDVAFFVEKLPTLRIFSDEIGKMNKSLEDIGGAALIISQFTLLADTDRGRRPSFEQAAPPEQANTLYHQLMDRLRGRGLHIKSGIFGASMVVSLENEGPVTLVLDSRSGKQVKRK